MKNSSVRASIMAQCIKSPSAMLAFDIRAQVQILDAPLSIYFPTNVYEKAVDDDPSTWISPTYVEVKGGVGLA